jgi:divalent metal cation (Fe/Co/Zn/Cd) transporter
VPPVVECRDLILTAGARNISVSCRCLFPGDLSVEEVNDLAGRIERLWRRADQRIDRITIHQEPVSVIARPT